MATGSTRAPWATAAAARSTARTPHHRLRIGLIDRCDWHRPHLDHATPTERNATVTHNQSDVADDVTGHVPPRTDGAYAVDHTFEVSDPVRLAVSVPAGMVRVTAGAPGTAAVTVAPADPSDRRAVEAAALTTVELRGEHLLVTAPEYGRYRRRSPALLVSVELPPSSTVSLRTASADLQCETDVSWLAVRTASGDVRGLTVTGDVTIDTASGDVVLDRVDGWLRVRGASGDVTVGRVGALDITTASGDLSIRELDGPGGQLRSASGDVRVSAAAAGELSVASVSGDVTVGVCHGTPVWMDVSTMSGDASSELPITNPTTGGGEPRLTLRVKSVSGDVTVRRPEALAR